MAEYQLEIKQLVDYPRCRIYRQFIRNLMEDRSIRLSGCSYLFYYTVLCSFANFRTSYRRIEGITYTIYPGEWVCRITEVMSWFRTRYQYQACEILEYLQNQHYISYSKLGRGKLIKFKITSWKKNNIVLDYNAPCQKDMGFFFFSVSEVYELISLGKCSEMDIVLDLWMNTIYKDDQVQGSDVGPVVYFRNCTGNPVISYAELSERWGNSKSTVGRILKKLADMNYLDLIPFPGRHGSVIYLNNYLSTMFSISDVMIDKEEVAMALNIRISIPDSNCVEEDYSIAEEQLCVPEDIVSVSKPCMKAIIGKVAKILSVQGLPCCECPKSKYKLYRLSDDCKRKALNYELFVECEEISLRYRFELRLVFLKRNIKNDEEVTQ